MARPLSEYHNKRDFQATPEPAGRHVRGRPVQALQYCVQKHDASHLHYDFRLELGGTLKSWAIPKGPSLDPGVRRLAVHVEDHPLDYAGFEGHIPEGHYGAGDVIVWDRGSWFPEGDPHEGYARGKLRFRLEGEKLGGVWNLFRTRLAGKKEQWLLVKSDDAQARPETEYDILQAQPHSVLSDRTLAPRQKPPTTRPKARGRAHATSHEEALPGSLKPQLATLVDTPPAGDWRYEIKFDGYRMLARIDGGRVQLLTRSGLDWTARMPHQARALAGLGLESAWLDGEMVVMGADGVADFQALQNAFDAGNDQAIVYYLFDAPFLNGVDLRECPLHERRTALQALLVNNRAAQLRYSETFDQPVQQLLDSACDMQLEGLIGKRPDSRYVSRRSNDWIKLKCQQRQEFVILGYTDPQGSRSALGALLLGLHDPQGAGLRYAGKVGTGFSSATLEHLLERLQPLATSRPTLASLPAGVSTTRVHWVQPRLLAQVSYSQMTRDGVVRHGVFHGLRDDKPAVAVTLERSAPTPGGNPGAGTGANDLRITHGDRLVDAASGATKLQVAEYYARVAQWILPQLQQRPVALVRAPQGLGGELFFQKHAAQLAIPGVRTYSKTEAGQAAMVIDRLPALLGAVQMNALELHTWNATSKDFDRPDRLVLDLDPDPTLPWKTMVEACQLTLTLLDELGLRAFIKTSGGKGLHLVVPLVRRAGWDEVKAFSQAMVQYLAGLFPQRLSAVSGPRNRVGRIFIDYLRNARGATTVCAYSLRAREGLPVSVPVHREELAQLRGAGKWTLADVARRLDETQDPWAGYATTRQSITAAMRRQMGLHKPVA
ncbi:MAG: DNA ligase D [Pseudomonas sp.]|uniref:DNA ligase D n=1 Tax=Pseudomonas sp. TaxID=306 RepID=UPI003D0DB9F9